MKKKLILSIVIMFFCCLILQNSSCIAEETIKKYSIDIEWGSLSFTYDGGTWDTDKLEYCSEEGSLFPAKGTIEGKPRLVWI